MAAPERFAPIEAPKSLVEQVYDALAAAICEGRLAPGAPLRQEALALEFGVSRQPVLQSLLLLEQQGFARRARRGLVVAPVEPSFVRHLYALRGALDALAARLAAGRRPDASEAAAVVAAGRAAAAGRKPRGVVEADMAFHRLVYALSGNPLIGEAAAPHWRHIQRIMALSAAYEMTHVWDEHEAVVEAIVRGDAERAERLARAHAEANAKSLVAVIEAAAERDPS